MADAVQYLRDRVHALESETEMQKGILMKQILTDPTIQWDVIFDTLRLRGRHRHKARWRRAVVQDTIRRTFVRGGPRVPRPRSVVVAAPRWVLDPTELHEFPPLEVWERFRTMYPVLAVYRSGWVPSDGVAGAAHPVDRALWEAVWTSGCAPIEQVARLLEWPVSLHEVMDLVVPFAQRLWPHSAPWPTEDGAPERRCVPWLRRAACLLHGFQLGQCPVRGVWEALQLAGRSQPAGS